VEAGSRRPKKKENKMQNEQTFAHEGWVFYVDQEEDGNFVVDLDLDSKDRGTELARVVGRFNSLDDAITAAKYEIEKMS
jgi:hypothetical protein